MLLDRAGSNTELTGNFGIGSSARNMIEDVRLPLGNAEALEPSGDEWRRQPNGHAKHGCYDLEEQEIPVFEVDAVAGARKIVRPARSEEARCHAVVQIERSQDGVVNLERVELSQRHEVGNPNRPGLRRMAHALDGQWMLIDKSSPFGSPLGAVAESRESRLVADEVEKAPRLPRPWTDLDVDCVGWNEFPDTFDQPSLQSSRLESGDLSGVVGKPHQSSEFLIAQTFH